MAMRLASRLSFVSSSPPGVCVCGLACERTGGRRGLDMSSYATLRYAPDWKEVEWTPSQVIDGSRGHVQRSAMHKNENKHRDSLCSAQHVRKGIKAHPLFMACISTLKTHLTRLPVHRSLLSLDDSRSTLLLGRTPRHPPSSSIYVARPITLFALLGLPPLPFPSLPYLN